MGRRRYRWQSKYGMLRLSGDDRWRQPRWNALDGELRGKEGYRSEVLGDCAVSGRSGY